MSAAGRISTGTPGLDEILAGGLPPRRVYLLQGEPGSGKTTLALRFLLAGIEAGERGLYVTMSESRDELLAVGRSHGWALDGLDIYVLSSGEAVGLQEENTLYLPAEVELGERLRDLQREVDRVQPKRVVIDSCSELRLLAQNPLRLRRHLLALKEQLVQRGVTLLLLENASLSETDPQLQSLVHGVVQLEQLSPAYGPARRRARVLKLREVDYRGGYHDMEIRRGGVMIFPRLIAADHHEKYQPGQVSSGIAELDALLGGGPDLGSSMLIVGPAGSGKSLLATQYVLAAASRGQSAAVFTFDEGLSTLALRAKNLGIDLDAHLKSGMIRLQQIDAAAMSPGEFVSGVRRTVEHMGARLVVIDSLNGYLQSMPEERFLTLHLHELLTFLRQRGVLTILLMAQHGFLGRMEAPVDVSYLADSVVVTRFFEAAGRVRKAISVVKRRTGHHEDTIREFSPGIDGLRVGPPLHEFRGILTGVPEYEGRDSEGALLSPSNGSA